MSESCIFCRIVTGEIPSRKVYEDEEILAFHDINPIAPVHVLVIPKLHIASMADLTAEHAAVMGRLMTKIPEIARAQGLNDGFRIICNTGKVGRQDVYHLHVHVIGGPTPLGPMLAKS
jgi:histidine triad (HIT) family protein